MDRTFTKEFGRDNLLRIGSPIHRKYNCLQIYSGVTLHTYFANSFSEIRVVRFGKSRFNKKHDFIHTTHSSSA